jgi:adenylate cyclase class IV
MPTNIEIKARVHDMAALRSRAEGLSDTPVQIIPQEDTFFHIPKGRLKLHLLRAELSHFVSPPVS